MTNAYVLTGTLTDAQTLRLSEPLPVNTGEVRLIVEILDACPVKPPRPPLADYLAELKKRQNARGHVPMTREEIDAHIQAERESWQ